MSGPFLQQSLTIRWRIYGKALAFREFSLSLMRFDLSLEGA